VLQFVNNISMIESLRGSRAILFRNAEDGSLAWDILPDTAKFDRLIAERASQGLIPIAAVTPSEALKAIRTDQQLKEIERDCDPRFS